MRRGPVLLALALALTGCPQVKLDPEGYRCGSDAPCADGYACIDNVCRPTGGDVTCGGVTCSRAAECVGSALRSYLPHCEGTTCDFTASDAPCAEGCRDGACVDACTGVVCESPPTPTCAGAGTLRTFAASGTCAGGTCTYAPTDVACDHGCSTGACVDQNLCTTGTTCQMPPQPACEGGSRRTFTAPGSCDMGTGQCTYPSTLESCPNGCLQGYCVAQALTFTQTGPRLKFPVTALDQSPGSNGALVLAVGPQGRLSRWNGADWADVATATPNSLNAVAFSSAGNAVVVGSGRTLLTWRSGAVAPVSLAGGSSTTRLVALSARSDTNVMVVDDVGDYWKYNGTAWSGGTLPSASGPFVINSVSIDESARERVGGTCGGSTCIVYRNPSSSSTFYADVASTSTAVTAVGLSFEPGTSAGSQGLVGLADGALFEHDNVNGFDAAPLDPSPLLPASPIVGVTAPSSSSARPVWVLSSSSSGAGGLSQLTRDTVGNVTASMLLPTSAGAEALGPTESQGVVLSETRPEGQNSIFHVTPSGVEAFDLGVDFAAVTRDNALSTVLVSVRGDVAVRGATRSSFQFARGPGFTVRGAEGRNGTGVLLVGQDDNSLEAQLTRFTLPSTFTPVSLTGVAGQTLRGVCRVSDTEGWAVGSSGLIFSVTATGATLSSNPDNHELRAVDCAPGVAVACGTGGTVLRFSQGHWAAASPVFPMSNVTLTSCVLNQGSVYVAGDGVFARLDPGAPSWVMLQSHARLANLLVRSPIDVYATASTEALHFDGTQWSPVASPQSTLTSSGFVGARVVFAGLRGLLIDGL
jgi:hypothetical protein